MAAAVVAIRKNEELEQNGAGDETEKTKSFLDMRSSIPSKENRDAELFLGVLVLG